MNYSIVFTSKADNDLEDAIKWYEKKKTFLGWEFREEVSRAIDKIVDDRIEYQAYSGDI